MVYAILLKLYSLLLSFENKSINIPHEALEINLITFAHVRSSISNEALEIISKPNTSFSL